MTHVKIVVILYFIILYYIILFYIINYIMVGGSKGGLDRNRGKGIYHGDAITVHLKSI